MTSINALSAMQSPQNDATRYSGTTRAALSRPQPEGDPK